MDTRRLSMKGTFASWKCSIIRLRYVFNTARGLLTWATPLASQVASSASTSTRSHMRKTRSGGRSASGVSSSGPFSTTANPRASSSLPVSRKISASSHSRPGECARSRNSPQHRDSLTLAPPSSRSGTPDRATRPSATSHARSTSTTVCMVSAYTGSPRSTSHARYSRSRPRPLGGACRRAALPGSGRAPPSPRRPSVRPTGARGHRHRG